MNLEDKVRKSNLIKYGDRNLEELKIESLTFRTNPELLTKKIDEVNKKEEGKIYE